MKKPNKEKPSQIKVKNIGNDFENIEKLEQNINTLQKLKRKLQS